MNSIISDAHIQVLKFIIPIFQKHDIDYHVTGGLAGNLYGSQWFLRDIDIEVAQKDMDKVVELFREYITIQPTILVDEEFELLMMTLTINDIDVEINQAEDVFVCHQGMKVKLDTDLSKAKIIIFENLEMRVQPLIDIIKYKEILGREEDLIDLRKLPAAAIFRSPTS
jgi:hypothetical protein